MDFLGTTAALLRFNDKIPGSHISTKRCTTLFAGIVTGVKINPPTFFSVDPLSFRQVDQHAIA